MLMANQMKNREEREESKNPWEQFGKGSKPWKVEHELGEKVVFTVGGGSGIFLGYAGQDGKMFKILRLSDKRVCTATLILSTGEILSFPFWHGVPLRMLSFRFPDRPTARPV